MTPTEPVSPETTPCPAESAAKAVKPRAPKLPDTKQAKLIALLRRKRGASVAELSEAIGWQAHSVRGAISGTVKKKLGLSVVTEEVAGRGRVYRIAAEA